MANYMEEVARILGVQLGEEFTASDRRKYMLTKHGLMETIFINHPYVNEDLYFMKLGSLLNGDITINRKNWKPQKGETFYAVVPTGIVESLTFVNAPGSYSLYKLGNCYKTREEAEANINKWVKFYASDEVLEV